MLNTSYSEVGSKIIKNLNHARIYTLSFGFYWTKLKLFNILVTCYEEATAEQWQVTQTPPTLTPSFVYIKRDAVFWLYQQDSCCPATDLITQSCAGAPCWGEAVVIGCVHTYTHTHRNQTGGFSPVKVLCRLSCLHASLITCKPKSPCCHR